jgi:glucokinase
MTLGIDVGGTTIKWGIFDEDLNLLKRNSKPTEANKGPETVIAGIVDVINSENIEKVGIGFPSVVSESGFVHRSPNMSNFVNIDLLNELNKRTKANIKIDNDANTAALAEMKLGAAKNEVNFLYVTLGTGIGGAIILNGKLIKGANSGAGEIGYTTINFDEKREAPRENRRGILEDYCGLPRMKEKYSELSDKKDADMKELSVMADSGDENSIALFEYYGEHLGYGIASVMNLLDINVVVIGGGLSQCTEIMYKKLNNTLMSRLLEHKKDNFDIRKAHFLNNAGIFGAATLANM